MAISNIVIPWIDPMIYCDNCDNHWRQMDDMVVSSINIYYLIINSNCKASSQPFFSFRSQDLVILCASPYGLWMSHDIMTAASGQARHCVPARESVLCQHRGGTKDATAFSSVGHVKSVAILDMANLGYIFCCWLLLEVSRNKFIMSILQRLEWCSLFFTCF